MAEPKARTLAPRIAPTRKLDTRTRRRSCTDWRWVPTKPSSWELDLQFSLGYDRTEFAISRRRIVEGDVDVAPMVTAEVGLDRVPGAFDALGRPEQAPRNHRHTLAVTAKWTRCRCVDAREWAGPIARDHQPDWPESVDVLADDARLSQSLQR
jgi:hypothetical protein